MWASSARSSRRSHRWTSTRCAGAMPPSTDAALAQLLAGIERELPMAVELRHRLHARPELAHAEEQTAAAVAEQLPVACATVGGTGRVSRLGPAGGAGGAGGGGARRPA